MADTPHPPPRRGRVVGILAAADPATSADRFAPSGFEPPDHPNSYQERAMSEEAEAARQALQESMDLRDQGHSEN